MLSAGTDGTVKVLDAATGEEKRQFGFQSRVMNAAFSSTGSHLVVGTADGYVTMIEIATGNEDGRFQTRTMSSADDGCAGRRLDRRAARLQNAIRIYQADGVLLKKFSGTRALNGIAWCPESDCILAWGDSGLLEVWDPFKPELVSSLRGHARQMRVAAFSPDGKSFASSGDDKQVFLWDATNGKRTGSLAGLKGPPTAMAWSRDGQRLLVDTKDQKQALVWTMGNPQPVIMNHKGYGNYLDHVHARRPGCRVQCPQPWAGRDPDSGIAKRAQIASSPEVATAPSLMTGSGGVAARLGHSLSGAAPCPQPPP